MIRERGSAVCTRCEISLAAAFDAQVFAVLWLLLVLVCFSLRCVGVVAELWWGRALGMGKEGKLCGSARESLCVLCTRPEDHYVFCAAAAAAAVLAAAASAERIP